MLLTESGIQDGDGLFLEDVAWGNDAGSTHGSMDGVYDDESFHGGS